MSGDLLRREIAAGAVAVEYRIRSFLGSESVRAANALAVAAAADRFDELRREMFAHQPPEHTGGFTTEDLLDVRRRAGLIRPDDVAAIQEGRYEARLRDIDEVFEQRDPEGTPTRCLTAGRSRPRVCPTLSLSGTDPRLTTWRWGGLAGSRSDVSAERRSVTSTDSVSARSGC